MNLFTFFLSKIIVQFNKNKKINIKNKYPKNLSMLNFHFIFLMLYTDLFKLVSSLTTTFQLLYRPAFFSFHNFELDS